MPDPKSPPPDPTAQAQHYPIHGEPATPSLASLLRARIDLHGPMPFADFMAAALYEPGLGYYAKSVRRIGRGGDFFTSVSVGPLFGELLARRFLKWWKAVGRPGKWRIIECGAHDGTLAADILRALELLDPAAFEALEYVIPEPQPVLQSAQKEKLADFPARLRLISDIAELSADPLPGIAFGNELLDALPFHLIEWKNGGWRECRVANGKEGRFCRNLETSIESLPGPFPEGYRTEIRTNYGEILAPLLGALTRGLLVWPDYGFARPEYYHPDRRGGTLRTFSAHKAGEDPLATPGEIDITAHVDFTAVAEAGMRLGCVPADFRSQGAWLTDHAREWLLSLENAPDSRALRQFQTLTHPAHLGGGFHVLELAWEPSCPGVPNAAVSHRLALETT